MIIALWPVATLQSCSTNPRAHVPSRARERERERESRSTGEASEPLHATAHSLMSLASSIVPPMMAAMPPTFSKDTLSPSTVIPMAASAAITTADQTE